MSDWRPFEPSREAVLAANRCVWHDDCAEADRWARVIGRPAVHETQDEFARRLAGERPARGDDAPAIEEHW